MLRLCAVRLRLPPLAWPVHEVVMNPPEVRLNVPRKSISLAPPVPESRELFAIAALPLKLRSWARSRNRPPPPLWLVEKREFPERVMLSSAENEVVSNPATGSSPAEATAATCNVPPGALTVVPPGAMAGSFSTCTAPAATVRDWPSGTCTEQLLKVTPAILWPAGAVQVL